jgi:hypothetical protein
VAWRSWCIFRCRSHPKCATQLLLRECLVQGVGLVGSVGSGRGAETRTAQAEARSVSSPAARRRAALATGYFTLLFLVAPLVRLSLSLSLSFSGARAIEQAKRRVVTTHAARGALHWSGSESCLVGRYCGGGWNPHPTACVPSQVLLVPAHYVYGAALGSWLLGDAHWRGLLWAAGGLVALWTTADAYFVLRHKAGLRRHAAATVLLLLLLVVMPLTVLLPALRHTQLLHVPDSLRRLMQVCERESDRGAGAWWAHTGGGNALAFKQPTPTRPTKPAEAFATQHAVLTGQEPVLQVGLYAAPAAFAAWQLLACLHRWFRDPPFCVLVALPATIACTLWLLHPADASHHVLALVCVAAAPLALWLSASAAVHRALPHVGATACVILLGGCTAVGGAVLLPSLLLEATDGDDACAHTPTLTTALAAVALIPFAVGLAFPDPVRECPLASPSELLASPSELLASPSELLSVTQRALSVTQRAS